MKRWRWLITIISVVVIALIVLQFRKPRLYTSRTRLVTEIESPATTSETGWSSGVVPPVAIPTGVVAAVPAATPVVSPVSLRPLTATQPPGTAATTPPTTAENLEPPAPVSPQSAVETLRVAVRSYGSRFGGNPVGNNAEITRALTGDNPKHVRFLDDARLNDKGELVDGWGTPYFFHQLSGQETEIRSAGPDKQMWTADDVMIR